MSTYQEVSSHISAKTATSGGFRGGAQGAGAPLLVEYLQKICKKTTEISIQKPF